PPPKTGAGAFQRIRLKPRQTPPPSQTRFAPSIPSGYEPVGDRWDEAIPGYMPGPRRQAPASGGGAGANHAPLSGARRTPGTTLVASAISSEHASDQLE